MIHLVYSSRLISQPGRPGKFLLKKAFAKYLNEPLLGQPKRGFVLPFAKWYKGPLKAMCQERLNRIEFLEPAEVKACWDALDEPSMASRITGLVSLSAFH